MSKDMQRDYLGQL